MASLARRAGWLGWSVLAGEVRFRDGDGGIAPEIGGGIGLPSDENLVNLLDRPKRSNGRSLRRPTVGLLESFLGLLRAATVA
jgi:hypothetical protein